MSDRRMKPRVDDGVWARVGRKHYRHESGIEIVYKPNEWLWMIVGGPSDGLRYKALWAAQHEAVRA